MFFDSQYEIDANPFAHGSQVLVYQCRSRTTGAACVAKVYDKEEISHRRYHNCLLEAEIGRTVPTHPNVMRVLEVFDEEQRVVLVCELMKGGTLFELLVSGGPLAEDKAGRLMYQVLQGLDHLHKNGVMHRDIKPENLFFRSGARDVIVIGDFGFATKQIPATGYMGSPQYSAPELALIALHRNETATMKAVYNEKCDLWSIGVVLFVMLTGLLPFDGKTTEEVFTSVMKNMIPFDKPACRAIPPKAKQLILSLTESNPSKRPTAAAALRNPWLANYKY